MYHKSKYMHTAVKFSFSSLVYRTGDNFAIQRQCIYEVVVTLYNHQPLQVNQVWRTREQLFFCDSPGIFLFFKGFFFVCVWSIFKVFVQLVTTLLLFMFWFFGQETCEILACGIFLTKDWTCMPCIGRQSLNHWTSRDVQPLKHF